MNCTIYQLLAFKSESVTQLCAVSHIREANVRVLPVHGSVTGKVFARDTPTFAYFASVAQLHAYSVVRCTNPRTMYSKTLHASS
jgi:hypothetical protein